MCKSNKIVVDLRTVFVAAMAYVILSRVQEIAQLFILHSVPIKKIYADPDALMEFERLNSISLNSNPSRWEMAHDKNVVKIFSLNCQSLRHKVKHLREDAMVFFSDIICVSETWLDSDIISDDLLLPGYELHLNSNGRGKGIAVYYKGDKGNWSSDVKKPNFQITKVEFSNLDVISLYRSSNSKISEVLGSLVGMLDFSKINLLCGDFNVCFQTNRENLLIRSLENIGFKQLVTEATHIKGGHIDHVYILGKDSLDTDLSLYSPYYCAKDHDAIVSTINITEEVDSTMG